MDLKVAADPSAAPVNGIYRLVPFGWATEILAILAGLVVSFFLFGYFNPYWRIADQDILLVYDALLQNQGLPREVVYHPAHLSVLALSAMFRLLHGLGILRVDSLSTLPHASDANAYNAAWTALVHVARLLSLSFVLAYLTAFVFLLRRLLGDWRIAVVGLFALAYSGGIAMSVRSVKTELLSAAFGTLSLLVLLIAARSPRMTARPALIGAAALLATLALDNKVQAIFLIGALPILMLPFGEPSDGNSYWSSPRATWALAALAAVALLAAAAATPLLLQGLQAPEAQGAFGMGVFQAALAVWIALGVLAFAVAWRLPIAEALASAACIVGGVALGLLPLYIHRETSVVAIVINPLAAMLSFVSDPAGQCGAAGCGNPIVLLFDSLWGMVRYHTFFLHTSPRPEIFLEWAVIAGIVFAFRRGERNAALQAGFLIATAWGIDTLQTARWLKQDYFNYTDPLIVVAAVILLAKVKALQLHPWAFPVGAALVAAHVAMSQAEPVKHAVLMHSGPENQCVIVQGLKRLDPFPFCRK
jgi:hypothetical protein